jgi:carbamoyl-phosphate synthase large subunit
MVPLARSLTGLGFRIVATRGTGAYLKDNGLEVQIVNKVTEGRPDITDLMRSGEIQLVINTAEGKVAIADSFSLRRTALTAGIAYMTTVAGARAAVRAIEALRGETLGVRPLQAYFTK